MPKNIVIFSDGTGQAGGINFDEARTNVYKLYRACRVGPDTKINPSEQVAFYDAGLGSAADGGHFAVGWMRWLYNLASMATGLGITRNIVDCYAAIIRLYEEGDRIFLVGFSRGAYTARSLAGVMAFCGIPRHLPDGSPLRRDPKSLRRLAEHAVKDVYQFCSSYDRNEVGPYRKFIMDTRDRIAAQFREQYGSSVAVDGVERPNVFPYFIGVFDTVAALGHKFLGPALVLLGILFIVGLQYFSGVFGPFYWLARLLSSAGVAMAVYVFLKNYLKIAPPLEGYGFFRRLATLHFTQPKHKFYDTTLSPYVGYAKHAISIDENRADFARVGWAPVAEKLNKRDSHGNLYFEQVWFPGVHADIGGGYLENEARLSDVGLNWMLAGASIIPDGLKHDASVLRLSPDPGGPQQDPDSTSPRIRDCQPHRAAFSREYGQAGGDEHAQFCARVPTGDEHYPSRICRRGQARRCATLA
jgi:type VI secretion system (T6SS) phospholipase Tle1-like effector